MKDFRDLKVWEKAHALVLGVYQTTKTFAKEERYGLTSQIRRSAVSIPSNIAEGCGRGGDPELRRYLQIAMGSSSELEYQLLLAHDLDYVEDNDFQELTNRVVEANARFADSQTVTARG